MATATLERGNTTLSLDLITQGGSPVAGADTGKPNLDFRRTGSLNPRSSDQFSALRTYTILGRFTGSNAFTDAIDLATLIKSNPNGETITLNIDMPEFDTDIPVVPAASQDAAVNLNFPPGKTNTVEVDIGLTRVIGTRGGAQQQATIPTTSGTGPIQITDGTNTVDLVQDITVSWSLGRPQDTIQKRPTQQYPQHTAKQKTAYEAFELGLQFGDNTVAKVNQLSQMFATQLGYGSLTLDFNGLYGLGAFDVVPDGSGALRTVREAGRKDTIVTPTINLRRVLSNQ